MAKDTKPKKAQKRVLDFSDVKEMGNFRPKRKPEGDYKAKITAVEEGTSGKGNEQWTFTIELTSDKTAVYPYYCGFDAKQIFKIFNLCIAAGLKAPKAKVAVDPQKLVGKLIGVTLEDDEYNDKPKSRISAVMPASELTDEEPVDDEDEPDDDDSEDEVDTDDESDDTEDEDEDEDDSDDEDEDEEDSDDEEDDSDEDDEEEDEEDEEPEPVKPAKKKKAAEPEPAKKAKKAAPAPEPKKAKKAAEVAKPSKKGTKAAKSGKKSIDLDDL